jgi:hypothetical protein
VALVLVLGVLMVFWARSSRDVGPSGPDAGDQWAVSYGVYVCNEFVAEGNATLSPFTEGDVRTSVADLFATADITITDTSVTLADGTEFSAGEDCDGTESVVSLTSWDAGAAADSAGLRRDGGAPGAALTGNGEQFTFAVAPADATIPRPPVAPADAVGDDTTPDATDAPADEPASNDN